MDFKFFLLLFTHKNFPSNKGNTNKRSNEKNFDADFRDTGNIYVLH